MCRNEGILFNVRLYKQFPSYKNIANHTEDGVITKYSSRAILTIKNSLHYKQTKMYVL